MVVHTKWSKRSLVRVLFRFWRRGFLCFTAVVLAAVMTLCLCAREYVSEAKVLVRLGRENTAVDPTASTGEFVALESNREAEMNSVIQSLSSRSNIEKVLDIVGADIDPKDPLSRERALASLDKQISVYVPKNSTVIVLSCLAEDPARAQRVVKTLLDVSMQEHMRVNRTEGSYHFFDEQAELLRSQLDMSLSELRDAKNRYGMVTLDGRRQGLQDQINAVELQQQQVAANLAGLEARTAKMHQELQSLSPQLVRQLVGGSPNNGLGDMRHKLYQLQTREAELLSRFTEKHPEVQAIREQVLDAQRILDLELPDLEQASKALASGDEADAASLRAKTNSLAQQHRQLTEQLSQLNDQALEVTQLERKANLLDANYTTYSKGLEQARIDQELKNKGISNLSVIQAPTFVPKAVKPKKVLTLLLALVAACGSSLGLMLLSEQWDESVRDMAGAERRLQVKVFASLPYVKPPSRLLGSAFVIPCEG